MPIRHNYKSLYLSLPEVRLNNAKIPPALRELIPYLSQWTLTSDGDLQHKLKTATSEDLQQFVQTCEKLQEKFENYIFKNTKKVPIPDERVAFEILYRNFLEARSQLWLLQKDNTLAVPSSSKTNSTSLTSYYERLKEMRNSKSS